MEKYICRACGYIYDPKEHNDVAFEDLDESYVCPICSMPKSDFEKM